MCRDNQNENQMTTWNQTPLDIELTQCLTQAQLI
jgi:hypothetical protein